MAHHLFSRHSVSAVCQAYAWCQIFKDQKDTVLLARGLQPNPRQKGLIPNFIASNMQIEKVDET